MAGRPLWVDNQRLGPAVHADAGYPALLNGNVAFAVLAFLGSGVEAAAEALRQVSVPDGVALGVSGWDGRCIVRLMAPDVWLLKQGLGRLIGHLAQRPLPRVWQMQGITP